MLCKGITLPDTRKGITLPDTRVEVNFVKHVIPKKSDISKQWFAATTASGWVFKVQKL